jgi:hypothetical protein
MTISAAMGNVPAGLTWKTGMIGALTSIVSVLSVYGILWMVCFTIHKHKKHEE